MGQDCKQYNSSVFVVVYPYMADTRPLHLAAKNNHLSCIRELMLNGADYNAVDSHGRTSMYVAAEMGHEDAVLEHLNNAYGKTILSLPAKDSGTVLLLILLLQRVSEKCLYLFNDNANTNFVYLLPLSGIRCSICLFL